MHDHPRRDQAIAAALAALAGYVDAVGFVASGGLFISFMSGNSTRLGIGLAQASQFAALAGSLLAAFVAGVTLATLIGRRLNSHRRRGQLLLVAALLGGGFTLGQIGFTFMTGNLVKIGQRLALALTGGPALAFLPWLLLWPAMIGGAVAGALAWPLLGMANLGVAAAVAAGLALLIDL